MGRRMIVIYNTYGSDIELLGVTIKTDSSRELSDIGNSEQITDGIDQILLAVQTGTIRIEVDGVVVNSTVELVKAMTGTSEAKEKYYYVNELVIVRRGTPEYRVFKGDVSSIVITAKRGSATISIVSEEGIKLQTEEVKHRQEVIIECDYKLHSPTIKIESTYRYHKSEVDVYIDGASTLSASEINDVIATFKG